MKIRIQEAMTCSLAVALAVISFMFMGCGGQQSSSESADEIIQADTANVDIAASSDDATPTVISDDTPQPVQKQPEEEAKAPPPEETPIVQTEPEKPKPVRQEPRTGVDEGEYVVKRGDTLMKIAFDVYGDIMQWSAIYDLNKANLSNPNQLVVGNKVRYMKPTSEPSIERNGEQYKIRKGDTLGSIAEDIYAKKSKWKKLWENNRQLIKDPNHIYAGFYLYYQISEEERQDAERIKASRLGNSVPPATPPAAAPASGGDGLSALSNNKGNRAPASTTTASNTATKSNTATPATNGTATPLSAPAKK